MEKIEFSSQKSDLVLNVLMEHFKDKSYSYLNKCLRKKDIRVNDAKITENIRISSGDKVSIFVEDSLNEISFYEKVFEDENIFVVNKAPNIEVCDGEVCLLDLINSDVEIPLEPVHRLDRNTEGIVVFAKNSNAKKCLDDAFKSHAEIEKFYLAEVYGEMKADGKKTAYLVKDNENSKVKIYSSPVKDGEKIVNIFRTIKISGKTSLVEIRLETGKTHQIRAHLAFLGFPVIGDGKYGTNEINRKYKAKKQRLTAYKMTFNFDKNCFLSYLNMRVFEIKPSWLSF